MSNRPMCLFFRLFDVGSGIAMDSKFRISGGCERRTGAIDLGFPKDQRPTSRSPDLPLPAARARDRSGEPGLVHRYHRSSGKRSTGPFSGPPHPHAPGFLVPGGDHGLGEPQGSRLAALQHHGWQGTSDGQCFHRAAMAFAEIRMRLSASLRDRRPGAGRDRPVDRLLQHLKASFGVRWANPRRGL